MVLRTILLLVGLALARLAGAPGAAARTGGPAATEAAAPAATPPGAAARLRPTMASALLAPARSFTETSAPAIEPLPAPRQRSSGVPLMAAGAVLFITGAIIGDDAGTLLMVGGAAVGAYGVYLYFR